MGNHEVTYYGSHNPDRHWASCKCGWESLKYLTAQLAEDDVLDHLTYIDKVRAHLSRTPSLRQQRNYFRSQAENPLTKPGWVPIWAQLADELDHRLNDGAHEPYEQLNLNLSEDEAT